MKSWRKRQKTLKEMFINREKEMRRELERLIKYSNAETLSTEESGERKDHTKEEEGATSS